ncbi:hypothetical protein [Neptuniibacter halophilus]|uniref:hypothetical protein n=1 Tax=Neptuniibacter halophilus TaxID=651666 RepID=UPI002572E5AB|nr:hypothetical protein [Neptuniibacter halophilus]
MKSWVLLITSFFCTTQVFGSECLQHKFKTYTNLQTQWQNDSTDLVTSKYPELSDVAVLYQKHQLALIQQRFAAFSIYLKVAPEKIQKERPINQWVTLSSAIKEDLSQKHLEFKKALEKVDSFRTALKHEDGDKLRKVFRSDILPSPEFKHLLEAFNSKVEDLNDDSCKEI